MRSNAYYNQIYFCDKDKNSFSISIRHCDVDVHVRNCYVFKMWISIRHCDCEHVRNFYDFKMWNNRLALFWVCL
jgi:hypothetical protein